MRIRSSKFIFIASIVVLTLMMVGPITAFILIDKAQISFLLLIPAFIIGIMFAFNFINYFSNFFLINETKFMRYFFFKKKLDIDKERVQSISYQCVPGSEIVTMFQINYTGKDDKLYFTQLSGNMYNLNKIIEAFKKYGYPVNE